jgi:hypothetical protein
MSHPESYREQNGCHNCKHKQIRGHQIDGFYPYCGLEPYPPANRSDPAAWPRPVAAFGICDCWEAR